MFFNRSFFITCMIICFLPLGKVVAQENLVFNPSFEINSGCPDNNGAQVNLADGWDTCRASADYFHVCATGTNMQVPHNFWAIKPLLMEMLIVAFTLMMAVAFTGN